VIDNKSAIPRIPGSAAWSQVLVLRRLGCWPGTCRVIYSLIEMAKLKGRSRSLTPLPPCWHRRPPDQPHRRLATMTLGNCHSLFRAELPHTSARTIYALLNRVFEGKKRQPLPSTRSSTVHSIRRSDNVLSCNQWFVLCRSSSNDSLISLSRRSRR